MDRPGGAAGLSNGSFGHAVDSPRSVHLRAVPRLLDRTLMRLSRVPGLSLWQHDRAYDPGGLRLVSPVTTGQILRSSALKLSALPTPEAQVSWGWLSLAGPRLANNFRGSIPTLLPCSTRLLTFVSARQRVLLPGWWLAVALGRTCTSWRTSTDFIEDASLESPQLRV
jgi:hypothetical protein